MLDLINEARADAGVLPVELGDNRAAQIHAENLAEACAGGHWGLDGTKPAMRYSLAGGYQVNAENVSAIHWCADTTDPMDIQIKDSMDVLMASSGHRAVLLGHLQRRVNLGLAFNPYGYLVTVQHFEGDYVHHDVLPSIEGGLLQIQGQLRNGALVSASEDLDVQVWYDPPPRSANRGQLAQTSCAGPGRQVAELNPLPPGRTSVSWPPFEKAHTFCQTPHDFPPDTQRPRSSSEAVQAWQAAKLRRAEQEEVHLQVSWVPATTWHTDGTEFAVTADLGEVLEEYGPGVYTVLVWAPVNGDLARVSKYPIFHGVEPPEGYGPR